MAQVDVNDDSIDRHIVCRYIPAQNYGALDIEELSAYDSYDEALLVWEEIKDSDSHYIYTIASVEAGEEERNRNLDTIRERIRRNLPISDLIADLDLPRSSAFGVWEDLKKGDSIGD